MQYVYRLETEDGLGVYNSGTVMRVQNELGLDLYFNKSVHPNPYNDPGLSYAWERMPEHDDWFFGFTDPEQMQQWFYSAEIRNALARRGVVMRKYEVDDKYFMASEHQAIFIRDKATVVAEYREF